MVTWIIDTAPANVQPAGLERPGLPDNPYQEESQ